MTCEYFDSDPDDALYNLARRYPGGIPALALRLGRSESTLKKQLSPAIFTHHLSPNDFDRVSVPGAYQPLHATCFRLGHIALQLPDGDADASELFQQVLLMLREEGELARCIQDATAEHGPGGKKITRREVALIEDHLEQCIGALATLREQVRAKHRKDSDAHGR